VGSNLQVMVRLATGVQLQASITNTGRAGGMDQGTPVAVQIPADALRVLRADGAGVADDQGPVSANDAAPRPVRTAPSR
jgi:hypothetical protein